MIFAALLKRWPILRSPWLRGALLAVLVAILWARGSMYRNDRDNWRSAFEAQRAATVATAQAAQAKAIAARIQQENRYAEIARTIDAQASVRIRDAGRAYADAHRLRPAAVGASCGGPVTAAPDQPAPSDNGPGAGLVVVERNRFLELVASAERLEAVHRWGETLITEGLAMPAVEFGGN